MIVNSTLSNNRVGIAVILDAASVGGSYVDPEVKTLFITGCPSCFAFIIGFILIIYLCFSRSFSLH